MDTSSYLFIIRPAVTALMETRGSKKYDPVNRNENYFPPPFPYPNNKIMTSPLHPKPKNMAPHPTFFPILKNIRNLAWNH